MTCRRSRAVVVAALVLCPVAADAQIDPAGGRSREDWAGTIDAMTSFGLNITSAERDLIVQYLATYLPFPPRQ
jgi:hypothetical protein